MRLKNVLPFSSASSSMIRTCIEQILACATSEGCMQEVQVEYRGKDG
jgi:hypothetical protein